MKKIILELAINNMKKFWWKCCKIEDSFVLLHDKIPPRPYLLYRILYEIGYRIYISSIWLQHIFWQSKQKLEDKLQQEM